MNKFYGKIGFAVTEEDTERPGIWKDSIVERPYYGDIYKNTRRYSQATTPTGSVNISNEISIVADPYANENFHNMRYITYMGTKWIIETVDATDYPRLKMTIGGQYNDGEE